jgi:arabinofuranan 3-O-arabinosyltransferase
VSPVFPGVPYEVAFDYRATSGPARWCLWLDGPERCANDEQVLRASDAWQHHRSTVVLATATTEARLYFYADGAETGPGTEAQPVVVAYRDADVRPSLPLTVSLSREADPPLSRVASARGGGDRWEIDLRTAAGPFVLALPDSYHDGWSLRGLPERAVATAVTVDGFRQGWVIDGVRPGPVTVTAQFAPAGWARLAAWSSAVAITVMLAGSAAARLRRACRS